MNKKAAGSVPVLRNLLFDILDKIVNYIQKDPVLYNRLRINVMKEFRSSLPKKDDFNAAYEDGMKKGQEMLTEEDPEIPSQYAGHYFTKNAWKQGFQAGKANRGSVAPPEVSETAQQGLILRKRLGSGGNSKALKVAESLQSGNLTESVISSMKKFFKNNKPGPKGTNAEVAWKLHGGDAGKKLVENETILRGFWYNHAKRTLIDVTDDGGYGDHMGYLWASDFKNAGKLGLTKTEANILKTVYDGNDHSIDDEEELEEVFKSLFQKNTRYLITPNQRADIESGGGSNSFLYYAQKGLIDIIDSGLTMNDSVKIIWDANERNFGAELGEFLSASDSSDLTRLTETNRGSLSKRLVESIDIKSKFIRMLSEAMSQDAYNGLRALAKLDTPEGINAREKLPVINKRYPELQAAYERTSDQDRERVNRGGFKAPSQEPPKSSFDKKNAPIIKQVHDIFTQYGFYSDVGRFRDGDRIYEISYYHDDNTVYDVMIVPMSEFTFSIRWTNIDTSQSGKTYGSLKDSLEARKAENVNSKIFEEIRKFIGRVSFQKEEHGSSANYVIPAIKGRYVIHLDNPGIFEWRFFPDPGNNRKFTEDDSGIDPDLTRFKAHFLNELRRNANG